MRGSTSPENEADESGDSATGERRPSIVALENMLKKVSESPFHHQYNNGFKMEDNHNLPAAAQTGELEPLRLSPQSGVSGGLARKNPFYAYYLESGDKNDGMEDAGRRTQEDTTLDRNFVFLPEFQSSPLDLQRDNETVQNGALLSRPQEDLLQTFTHNHTHDIFQTQSAQNVSVNGHYQDVTLNSPHIVKANPPGTQDLPKSFQSKSSDLLKGEVGDLFKAAKGGNSQGATPAKEASLFDGLGVDPFKSSNEEEDLLRSQRATFASPFNSGMPTETELFGTVPTIGGELFKDNKQEPCVRETDIFGPLSSEDHLNVFSPSFSSTVDPFPSPILGDLFQNDPFGGASDIFQPVLSKTVNGSDKSELSPGKVAAKATYSTPPSPSPRSMSEKKLHTLSSPDFFTTTLPESLSATHKNPFDGQNEAELTTPLATKRDVLQPGPPHLSQLPNHSPAEMGLQIFKRPPKPLPRIRPPRPEKPIQTTNPIEHKPTVAKSSPKPVLRPLPKPVIRSKPKTQERKSVDPENYVVLEDILLIGQERCVEDWPEDSPQLDPEFKPSGKFRLRRESLKVRSDLDGGVAEDQHGFESNSKRKDRKFRVSLLSRRGFKDKFPDEKKEGRSKTSPVQQRSSKDYFSETQTSTGENEEQSGLDYKKNPLKTKVNQLLRRTSTVSSIFEGKLMSRHLSQESKDDDINKKTVRKKDSVIQKFSEGPVSDDSTGEEEAGEQSQYEDLDSHGLKRKKKMKIKFVPQRGFTIAVEKEREPKGAYGYTPRKNSKENSLDDGLGAYGSTSPKKLQNHVFEDVEELKHQTLQSTSKAALMDEENIQKSYQMSAGFEDTWETEDGKPTKPTVMKLVRQNSKDDILDFTNHKKSNSSADELEDHDGMEDWKLKSVKHKSPVPFPRKSKPTHKANGQSEIGFSHRTSQQTSNVGFADYESTPKGKNLSPGEMYDIEEDPLDIQKPQKKSLKFKGLKKHKAKSKISEEIWDDPPGATSSDYLSEAAKAEWRAAQMDERAVAGLEDADGDGDTDSLMEWWYTVEKWDEVPSDDEEKVIEEDECKSFTNLADKVHRGLRVFNKVFTERAEVLWQHIITLHATADDINNFHHKAKIAGITGGTTTAVGGVTAIAGLAMAPFTLGASLVITAVGVGVATAGGITSASAAISDNVNNMHDRKKVETVLQEYEEHLLDIGKILHFVNQGLYKLRGHPFLRSGTQHYSQDWEIRRAVQMISLVDSPVFRATEITDAAVTSVQGLFKGMDKYFSKESRELKKGYKKEVVGQIKELANVLNDGIVELNAIREELQDATGNM